MEAKTGIGIGLIALVGALAIGSASTVTPGPILQGSSTASGGSQLAANQANHLRRDILVTSQFQDFFFAGGIEIGSAGFHLVFNDGVEDSGVRSPGTFPDGNQFCVRGWCYWDAAFPMYPDLAYSKHAEHVGVPSDFTVPVSFRRMLDAGIFSYSLVTESGGTYGIQADLDSDAIDALDLVLAPVSTDPFDGSYRDWYGLQKTSGEEPTEMKIALTVDNLVYLPIDVTQIMADLDASGAVSYSVIIATGLLPAEATTLLDELNDG